MENIDKHVDVILSMHWENFSIGVNCGNLLFFNENLIEI